MYLYNFFIRITLNKMTINEDYLINYSSGINKILSQSKLIPILVIDDLANRKHHCDFLLDQNYFKNSNSRYINLVPNHCTLLTSTKFCLLKIIYYV